MGVRLVLVFVLVACSVVPSSTKKADAQPKPRYLLNKPQCNQKTMKRIEMVAAKAVTIGPHGRKFPENHEQVKGYCNETNKLVDEVEAFMNDCYSPSVRDFAKILLYQVRANLRRYCSKKKGASKTVSDLLGVAKCANKHAQSDDHCLARFSNQTGQLVNIANEKLKIPHTCCFYHEAMRCFEDFLQSIPCMRRQVPIMMDMIRGVADTSVDIICGEYANAESDVCSRLGPPPPPTKPNPTRYVTFLFALIDMVNSIGDLQTPTGKVTP